MLILFIRNEKYYIYNIYIYIYLRIYVINFIYYKYNYTMNKKHTIERNIIISNQNLYKDININKGYTCNKHIYVYYKYYRLMHTKCLNIV